MHIIFGIVFLLFGSYISLFGLFVFLLNLYLSFIRPFYSSYKAMLFKELLNNRFYSLLSLKKRNSSLSFSFSDFFQLVYFSYLQEEGLFLSGREKKVFSDFIFIIFYSFFYFFIFLEKENKNYRKVVVFYKTLVVFFKEKW